MREGDDVIMEKQTRSELLWGWCLPCRMDMDSIPCEHGIIVIRCPNCKSKGLKLPAKLRKEIEEIAKKQNAK